MIRSAHILQLAVIALLGIGLVMVHSAGLMMRSVDSASVDPLAVFKSRDAVYVIAAVVAMMIASRLDVSSIARLRGYRNPLIWGVLISFGLMAATLVPGVGIEVNGAARWLGVQGVFTFQPSELMKLAMIVLVALWCGRAVSRVDQFWRGLVPIGLLVVLGCGLIVIHDLGTAVLIGFVAAALLLAGGAKVWHLALTVPIGIAGAVVAMITSPYRVNRLLAFLDPWADPAGAGYHPIQSQLAFANGGLAGRGLGNGVQKFEYLPEDTTDFIYAVIGEELGIVGPIVIVTLYALIGFFGLRIIARCTDPFGRLLALGILLMVLTQAMFNIAVVTVVVPTKGIALPLISSGGTGWVLTAFSLGLIAALDNAYHINQTVQHDESNFQPASLEPAAA